MSDATADALRPAQGGIKGWIMAWVLATALPRLLRLLQWLPWNCKLGVVFATRNDEVREVFLNNDAFGVPYKEKLDVIMGGEPFFLGMDGREPHQRDADAMRKVVRADDIASRLVPKVLELGEKFVQDAGHRIEVVDYVRRLTFAVYQDYFGIPDPPLGNLPLWATRLFEFQFADGNNDPSLLNEVKQIGPKLRGHIDQLIADRKHMTNEPESVLDRCIARQREGDADFADIKIRTALMGFIVGGPPQPPMVVPQALEQLLRRPDALVGAQQAAQENDDQLLAGYVFEAMRFDPLAPFMPRRATKDAWIAAGTPREILVPEGTTVFVAFSAAMMDKRRLRDPKTFNPRRLPYEYIHFGYGLHQCFGIHMNLALLPLMLKPLLRRRSLQRAAGAEGRLRKRGVFAERLWVEYNQH